MPWIDEERCTGCGICVKDCPVDAINMRDNRKAEIDMTECIRCGRCHEICPQEAVRHDSELIPQEIKENIKWVKELMQKHKTTEEKKEFIGRIKKYFNKEKMVAEKTLGEIESIDTER